jgi:hypothetical protein
MKKKLVAGEASAMGGKFQHFETNGDQEVT